MRKSWLIKKGNHYSNAVLPKLYFGKAVLISEKITFAHNCRYDLKSDDQADINKLFGIGFLPWHRVNSIRFGWRYDLDNQKMEILAYYYINKKRSWATLAFLNIGEAYTYTIKSEVSHFSLSIKDSSENILVEHKVNFKPRLFGYSLKPYFGGNRTAPHDMSINFF